MVDYVGQKRVFLFSVIIFALSVPVSIAIGFYKDNFMYALYFGVGTTIVVMILFGPNWPFLNLDKPDWKPNSDVPTPQEKAKEEAVSGAHKRGQPRR